MTVRNYDYFQKSNQRAQQEHQDGFEILPIFMLLMKRLEGTSPKVEEADGQGWIRVPCGWVQTSAPDALAALACSDLWSESSVAVDMQASHMGCRGLSSPHQLPLFFFSLCPEGLTALKTNIWPTYASSSAGYLCHPLILSLLPCEAGIVTLLQRKHLPRETRINSTSSHPRPVLLLSSKVMSSPKLFYILSRQECN